MKKSWSLLLILFFFPEAQALEFNLPIRCTLGKDCFIQNYVDETGGSGWNDYMCQHLSYNGHDGTDFRLRDKAAMDKGVEVIAAAPGIVTATRDGEEDINLRKNPHYDPQRGCGNAVLMDDADGYHTMYCHMKRGSIRVKKGDTVTTGQTLGLVGLSGQTEFPHVHLTIKKNGQSLDPFTNTPKETGCTGKFPPREKTLWSKSAYEQLKYQPSAFLNVGVSTVVPNLDDAQDSKYTSDTISNKNSTVFLWTAIMGTQAGDTVTFELRFPDKTTHQQVYTIPRDQAQTIAYMGVKSGTGELVRGIYVGEVVLQTKQGFKLTHIKSFTVF